MKKLIVANWKMYLALRESVALAKKVLRTTSYSLRTQVVLCPSFVALEEVGKVIKRTNIALGAQDVEPEHRGAFTGEVGLDDLGEIGVQYVLVGHSERRRNFGETDAVVNKKLRAVLASGMRPILCVGEPVGMSSSDARLGRGRSPDRKRREYVGTQVKIGLKGISQKDLKRVVIAYEPIWAIGSDRADTPEDAGQMHEFIRGIVGDISILKQKNRDVPITILYGGSVNAKNAAAFAHESGIDGLLIGRASTEISQLRRIVRSI